MQFSVTLQDVIKEFSLKPIFMPSDLEGRKITESDVNRPGLELSGFYEFFNNKRIQIMGKTEEAYLNHLGDDERAASIEALLVRNVPLLVITTDITPCDEIIKAAKKHNTPLMQTTDATSDFLSSLISYLNVQLAPRITRHGVLVEVYGEGMLLLGDSGIGKSETAVELIKRGHRLIADDAVEIRRVSSKTLVGSAPDNIRHFIELRGIGIINARRLFGMGSVKLTEKIDLIVNLEIWDQQKQYDRMGVEGETTELLGLKITSMTVPVKPGRNLAVILEAAAMNNRQKKMGYNAAKELLKGLGLEGV